MARALFFHYHGGQRKLLGDLHTCPLFIPIGPEVDPEFATAVSKLRTLTALDFEQLPKLGQHKEIFAYQVIERPGSLSSTWSFTVHTGHRSLEWWHELRHAYIKVIAFLRSNELVQAAEISSYVNDGPEEGWLTA